MRFRALMILAFALAPFILGACSQSLDSSHPVLPDTIYAESAESSGSGNMNSGHNLLGYWNITVDSDAGTADAVPVRQAEIHLNILTWLENGPCTDCLQITFFEKDIEKNLFIDISLTHPYPTEPKFSGFDVRGICMFTGGILFQESGLLASSNFSNNPELLNADGFSSLYHPGTAGNGFQGYIKGKLAPDIGWPDATVNGYKYFCDSIPDPLDLTDPAEVIDPSYVTDRGVFRAGEINTRRYKIKSSTPAFSFGYAVDASWDTPGQPIVVPDSFPQTANCPEAWHIETEMSAPLATTANATASLVIDVYDWQGAGTITDVNVEAGYPSLWDGLITATEDTGGSGTKRFVAELINEFGNFPPGDYPVMVQVNDTESVPGGLIDKTAWKLIFVTVVINNNPVCAAEVSNPEPDIGETITFTDTSTDPDGPGDLKESWWDLDWDGEFETEGFEVEHSFDSSGIYYVDHKIIDNANASDTLDSPMEFDVGLFITLAEDLAAKDIGVEYRYTTLDAPYSNGSVIDITDTDGPWDFTTIGLGTPANTLEIIDDGDIEVSGFINDFNLATTHFVKYSGFYDPFIPVIYQAENHYFSTGFDKLYVYGFHDPYLIGSAPIGPPDTVEYLAIPYPLGDTTDYLFEIDDPGFFFKYAVEYVGTGEVTVPYDGGTIYDCLLFSYVFRVSAGGPVIGDTINFTFITDEGIVVANVISVNQPPTVYNWNPSANAIIGDARFQALNLIQ